MYTLDELSQYFHLPINEVAKELGVCATVLKKICRKNGIKRWPHRKIKSLARMIETLQSITPSSPADAAALQAEIDALETKKPFLMRNPNVSYKTIVPKYCVSACQSRVQKAQGTGTAMPPPSSGAITALGPNPSRPSSSSTPSLTPTRPASTRQAARKRTHSRAFGSADDDSDYEEEFDNDDEEFDSDEDYYTSAALSARNTTNNTTTNTTRPLHHQSSTANQKSTNAAAGAVQHRTNVLQKPSVPAPPLTDDGVVPLPPRPVSSHVVEEDAANILLAFSQPETIQPTTTTAVAPLSAHSLARSRAQLYSSSDAVACINALPTLQLKPKHTVMEHRPQQQQQQQQQHQPSPQQQYQQHYRQPTTASWLPAGDATATLDYRDDAVPKRRKISHPDASELTTLPPISTFLSMGPPSMPSKAGLIVGASTSSIANPMASAPTTAIKGSAMQLPTLPPFGDFLGHSVPTLHSSPFSSPNHSPPPSPPPASAASGASGAYHHHRLQQHHARGSATAAGQQALYGNSLPPLHHFAPSMSHPSPLMRTAGAAGHHLFSSSPYTLAPHKAM